MRRIMIGKLLNRKTHLDNNIKNFKIKSLYYGWGRKKSGLLAIRDARSNGSGFTILEDGFIRSIGLGVNGSESFSMVMDDVGIYYDASMPSKLENILNEYSFSEHAGLMDIAKKAISLIRSMRVSKYNNSGPLPADYFKDSQAEKILIIAQTAGDASLKYGMLKEYTTDEIIKAAIKENPGTPIYIKIHPDVLAGKKKSDVDISRIPKEVKVISEDINPISLLNNFTKVYTKTSQMGFEALMVGCDCVCFGMPFYAGWGLTDDRVECDRRTKGRSLEEVFAAAYILYTEYYNPYTKKPSNVIDTIETIIKYRDRERNTDKKVYLFGFSRWKHRYMYPFLTEYKKSNIIFINPIFSRNKLKVARGKGLTLDDDIYLWGRKKIDFLDEWLESNKKQVTRVEDGFIRSVGLGSDLTQPYSMVIDEMGIYFDPGKESRLENILSNYDFDANKKLLMEAEELVSKIQETKISKYNSSSVDEKLLLPKNKTIKLVIGQVEDDASIIYGGNGMNNSELLKEVKNISTEEDSFIVYKPHPDVESGNRIGKVPNDVIIDTADLIYRGSLHDILDASDEVHTITSLTGFEALMKNKTVFVYGSPFYAGWGLTIDKDRVGRRVRKITSKQLAAATLILYPRYISPENNNYCTPDVLIDYLTHERERIKNDKIYRINTIIRNYISRYGQKILTFFK